MNCDCMRLKSERKDVIGREWCPIYALYVGKDKCNETCNLYMSFPKTPIPACCEHFFSKEELKRLKK